MLKRPVLGVILVGALSACGGGGSATSPQTPATPIPSTSAQLLIRIAIPAPSSKAAGASRHSLYVSSNTLSASIAINAAAPVVVNLGAGSSNCTPTVGGGRTCTVSVKAPVAPDIFVEKLYSGLNATGAVLSQGRTSQTIVAGVANTVTLTLGGNIASLSLTLANPTPAQGTAAQIPLTVNFLDAGGASIIGGDAFVTPVTLSDSDASGITSLSAMTLSTPADAAALVVNYSGAVLAQATIGATSGAVAAKPVTLTPQVPVTATTGFNDYTTFGYDNGRDVYNPNTTTITPASVANLHLAWQSVIGGQGDYNTQTQPVLATGVAGKAGVLLVGGGSGFVYGIDALTGTGLWDTFTGQETYTCENNYTAYFGVGGTVAYDPGSKSLYTVGNANPTANAVATNSLFHLDAGSGAILGQVNFAPPTAGWPSLDFSHTSVTLGSNGLAYVGTSATCDISSWRGRVAAVSVPSMSLANTFYTVWDPQNARGGGSQPWGGGGIWGWGGVSLDSSGNVFTGVGNTDDGSTTHGGVYAPFSPAPHEYSGLGESVTVLSPDLSKLEASDHPIPAALYSGVSADLDLQGTPTLFTPNGAGCDPMLAVQAKSGTLYLYDRTRIGSGPVGQYQLAPSTYSDGFLGAPSYSPATGLLYVAVTSSNSSLFPPGMIAINPGCNGNPSVVWHAAFGPDSYAPGSFTSPGTPRSVPAASAGGVVFVGTNCTIAGNGCSATTTSSAARTAQGSRKPLICCAPPGSGGGAVWALDASTGVVLNGGNPIITTIGPIRVPPTIDGNWIFVLDNSGNLYGLTIDPHYASISTKQRSVSARMLTRWGVPAKLH